MKQKRPSKARAACLLLLRHVPVDCAPSPIVSGTTLPQDGRLVTGRRPVLLMTGWMLCLGAVPHKRVGLSQVTSRFGPLLTEEPRTQAPTPWKSKDLFETHRWIQVSTKHTGKFDVEGANIPVRKRDHLCSQQAR